MEKRKLGRTNLEVTSIGFGALEIGRDWGIGLLDDQVRPDEESAGKTLNFVLDQGINLIDTARAYHRSEERIGKSIAHRRSEFVLASKCGEHSNEPHTYYDFSYKAVKDSINKSLDLLRTDVIDVMQIHFGPDPEKVLADGETVAAMSDAQAQGKIRFLGASPHHSIMAACIESGAFDVLQVEYSLLNRQSEELIAEAAMRNIGILIRGGLGQGYLTPKVQLHLHKTDDANAAKTAGLLNLLNGNPELLPAAAIQFLLANNNISSVLVGSKSSEHIAQIMAAATTPLPTKIEEIIARI